MFTFHSLSYIYFTTTLKCSKNNPILIKKMIGYKSTNELMTKVGEN